jgi:hypothetical protein
MTDLVTSVFRLSNARFRMAPKVDFNYLEKETGIRWHIIAGCSRAYLLRFGVGLAAMEADALERQNADSYFMMSSLRSAFLLGGKGLFQAAAVGRLFFKCIQDQAEWFAQLDFPTTEHDVADDRTYGWLKAFAKHTMLRRAAADAHSALSHTHEAGTFVYRGLEWLVVGEGRSWDDLASDMGVSKADVRDFKRLMNVDYGVRHASRSGVKLRANLQNYSTWVCALIDATNATRSRLEPGYEPEAPEMVAEAVIAAMPADPYP